MNEVGNAINYRATNTLEGFDGNAELHKLGMPQIRDKLYMLVVMGGTQQWNAQVQSISGNHINVMWTVRDRFGAGKEDAQSPYPGLPSMYWLQHNSSQVDPTLSNKFVPFSWGIQVLRKK